MSTYTSPSGPKGVPLLGNVIEFGKDPLHFLTKCAREHGDIVRFRLEKERDNYLISHPDYIEYVLTNKKDQFSKGYQSDPIINLVLGNGLVSSEGDFWLRQRRLSQPAFHPKRIAGYADVIVNDSRQMLHSWESAQILDIHKEMMQLTMNIIAKTLFDVNLQQDSSSHTSDALDTVMTEYNKHITSVYRHVLPLIGLGKLIPPVNKNLRQAMDKLDTLIYSIIEERRENPGDRGDLLSMLISTYDQDDGSYMTDQQLRDEVITLFLAGHETTANTLSWCFYQLALHPHIEQKLYEEVRDVLGNRSATIEDLPSLTYTEYVIKETLRINPPVWLISRIANEDVEIGGYHIPQGSEVSMSQWVMHRHPNYFNDPLTFSPERWSNENEAPSKFVYFPFGGGSRVCIGNHFAMMEAVLILASIIQRYEFELVDNHPVEMEPSITLRPKHGINVSINPRHTL